MLNSKINLDAAERELKQASKDYEQANIRYKNGMISSMDLLSAKTNFEKKAINKELRKYDFIVNYFVYELAQDGVITG